MVLVPALASAQDVVVYYHTDAIGSVRAITDDTGAVIARYDYLPFGEPWDPQPSPDVRQFAGKERDAETGLDYFGARYYASGTGRFTSVDPLMDIDAAPVNPQRWNRYTYALNNPLKFTDPGGRNPLLVGGGIGATVFGGWQIYQNVRQGRPWHENVGVEASKGLIIGATLGFGSTGDRGHHGGCWVRRGFGVHRDLGGHNLWLH